MWVEQVSVGASVSIVWLVWVEYGVERVGISVESVGASVSIVWRE